jgi:redox-sensing transcriptional repressor
MGKQQMFEISKQALQRLPYYLNYLKALQNNHIRDISAPTIAREMNLNEVQVRKDLAAVSSFGGKPKVGFNVEELIRVIEAYLGYDNVVDAVLVGAGNLGKALLFYHELKDYGMSIVAAFDSDETVLGAEINGTHVFSMDKLKDLCQRLNAHIGIVAVPAAAAQSVCDLLIESGILAVWNFTSAHLNVPDHILVQNENMAVSLAMLSNHLQSRIDSI